MSEHSHTLIEIRDSIRQLERRVDARFDGVNTSFDRVNTSFDQVNARFEQFEGRFGQLEGRSDSRFDQLERRFETRFDAFDRRLEGLDEKVARHFTWLVGIQVTALIAIVGALLARP